MLPASSAFGGWKTGRPASKIRSNTSVMSHLPRYISLRSIYFLYCIKKSIGLSRSPSIRTVIGERSLDNLCFQFDKDKPLKFWYLSDIRFSIRGLLGKADSKIPLKIIIFLPNRGSAPPSVGPLQHSSLEGRAFSSVITL